MSIGKKIRELRRVKNLSQEELGEAVGTHLTNIGRYERDQQMPSAEAIKKLAEIFEVSADYLLFDDKENTPTAIIKDKKTLEYLKKVENLPQEDKETIFAVIDAFLFKHQINQISSQKEKT